MVERRFIVVDGNPPWVRSVFLAMPAEKVEVFFLRVYNVKYLPKLGAALRQVFRWNRVSRNVWERYAFVPGWTRFSHLSKSLITRACRALPDCDNVETVSVFTAPHYRDLPQVLPPGLKLYYIHDTLGTFGWNFEPIISWEQKIVSQCDAVITVSKQVALDLQAQISRPVRHSPNAVAESFIEQLRKISEATESSAPSDIAAIPRPIVGCTGQINHSYDWGLIAGLADALPEVSFVFVGPLTKASAETEATISRVLARPNVFWLGRKEHSELPQYLAAFDICFNPLVINADNDRRSPLRLFDYMASDKPILSTGIAEALLHREHIACIDNEEDAVRWIKEMAGVKHVPNADARHQYVRRHTWGARAAALLEFVEEQTGRAPTPSR